MLWALVGMTVLAAGPPPPPRVALTSFRLTQANAELGEYAEDRFAQRLIARGIKVTTPADLQAVMGLERQKQLLGCADDNTSCLAEISAALGVPFVATGRLTRLGNRLEVDVRVIRQSDGQVVATASDGTDDEKQLGAVVERCAAAIADQLLPKAPGRTFAWKLWGPVAGGVVALAGGAVCLAHAESGYAQWTTPGRAGLLADDRIAATRSELNTQRGLGFGLLGAGAALIAGGIVWNMVAPAAPVAVSVAPNRGGATLVLGGRF